MNDSNDISVIHNLIKPQMYQIKRSLCGNIFQVKTEQITGTE